eukprot:g14274.t1
MDLQKGLVLQSNTVEILDERITKWMQSDGSTGTSTDPIADNTLSTILANVNTIAYDDNYVYIRTSGIPSHAVGPLRTGTVPGDLDATYRFTLNPTAAAAGERTESFNERGTVGIMLNGVAFFNGWDSTYWDPNTNALTDAGSGDIDSDWRVNALWRRAAGMDEARGHASLLTDRATGDAQTNPDGTNKGLYHYHMYPESLVEQLDPGNDGTKGSPIIGYVYDGYAIVGPYAYEEQSDGSLVAIQMTSSYGLVDDRASLGSSATPSEDDFELGSFLEDFVYKPGTGTLNEFNMAFVKFDFEGRAILTDESDAEGQWAYFLTLDAIAAASETGNDIDLDGDVAYPYITGVDFYGVFDGTPRNLVVPDDVTVYFEYVAVPEPGAVAIMFLSGLLASAQPNILFIMADDLGWADTSNSLTTMGNPSDFYETPTLDQLAAQGMAFTHAYANPSCAPTRTALLSGAYGPRSTNNVFTVSAQSGSDTSLLVTAPQGTNGRNVVLPVSTTTYAEVLQSAGYSTAYVGKFHVTNNEGQIVSAHGFDANYGGSTTGGPGAYHASDGTFADPIGPGLNAFAGDYTQDYVDNYIKPYATDLASQAAQIDALVGTDKHLTDASIDAAIDFMSANTSEPFFVQLSTHTVHSPSDEDQARDDLLAKYQAKTPGAMDSNASYAALIEGMDQGVGRLVDYLQTTDDPNNPGQTLDENTLVIFYSDNGGLGTVSNSGGLSGSKSSLYEGGIRVPMIAWSGNDALVDGGTISDEVIMPVDFYTTFAALAGASLPSDQIVDGIDLTGVISDVSSDPGRESVFWHLPVSGNERDPGPASITELLGLELLAWLDEVDAPLATLRADTFEIEIDGRMFAYVSGGVTELQDEVYIVAAGEEMPLFIATPQQGKLKTCPACDAVHPGDLCPNCDDNPADTLGPATLTATKLGESLGTTSRKLNLILAKIGWV